MAYAMHVEIVLVQIARNSRHFVMLRLTRQVDAVPAKMLESFVQILRLTVLQIPRQLEEYAEVRLHVV